MRNALKSTGHAIHVEHYSYDPEREVTVMVLGFEYPDGSFPDEFGNYWVAIADEYNTVDENQIQISP